MAAGKSDKKKPKTVVKKSPIHGRGLFADQKIKNGTFIGVYKGKRTKKDGMHVLWVEDDDKLYGIDGQNKLRYLNHSKKPNAEFDGADLFAIRDIPKGKEITFHYGEEWED